MADRDGFTIELHGDPDKCARVLRAALSEYGAIQKEAQDFADRTAREFGVDPFMLRAAASGIEGTFTVRGALRTTKL